MTFNSRPVRTRRMPIGSGEIASAGPRRRPERAASVARPPPLEISRSSRAEATFREELEMRPLQAHCHLGLGKLYRRIGRLDGPAPSWRRRSRCSARWGWRSGCPRPSGSWRRRVAGSVASLRAMATGAVRVRRREGTYFVRSHAAQSDGENEGASEEVGGEKRGREKKRNTLPPFLLAAPSWFVTRTRSTGVRTNEVSPTFRVAVAG